MPTEQLHERWIVEIPQGGRREFDERHVFAERTAAMAYYTDYRTLKGARVSREIIHVIK